MRLAVTTLGCDGGRSGIGRYTVEILKGLSEQIYEAPIGVFHLPGEQKVFLPQGARSIEVSSAASSPIASILWHQFALPLRACARDYDVLFLPAANRRVPYRMSIPMVGTVHDFSPLHCPEKYDSKRMFYVKSVLPSLIKRLDRVITVSESSKKDIVEYVGVDSEKVHVIPLAADASMFFPRTEPIDLTAYGVTSPYFLYISRLEHPGKNHVRLIRAFNRFREKTGEVMQLVLVGSAWMREQEVYEEAARSPYADSIVFPGFVKDEDLPLFYAGAKGFVFPSLYEGFGLPVLEAMASGCPVACSDVSSMPEVGGDAVLYFDPTDEEQIAARMEELLNPTLIQAGLTQAASFSWDKTVEHTLSVLKG